MEISLSSVASTEQTKQAAQLLREGRLVAFPTETVYGLGANALDARAVEKIFRLKERPLSSPLIVHVSSIAMARTVASQWPELAQTLAMRFWPGPLTLILPKSPAIPDLVTAGFPSVGVRIPAHPLALALIEEAGVPIAAPSANRFAQISPTTAEHVRRGLGDGVDLILDGGPCTVGIESTVVSLVGEQPMVLRPGMISVEELESATGLEWLVYQGAEVASLSPGLHQRHYAPQTPLFLLRPGVEPPAGHGRFLDMPGDPAGYAELLYSELHAADGAGWDWIAVAEPPDTPEWLAIRDRLQRASFRP